MVSIEDDPSRDMNVDVLVNNNIWITESDYLPKENRFVLLGSQVNLIRPEFFVERIPTPGTKPRSILITLGGEDPSNHTDVLLDYLGHYLLGTRTTVVLGPAHPQPDTVQSKVRKQLPEGICLVNPPNFLRYIVEADIAITAGGTTCYELAAAGVPMLGVAVESHQKLMIDAMSEAGCLIPLSNDQTLDKEEVVTKFQDVLESSSKRRKMMEAAQNLFQGPGADYLTDQILKLYYQKCGNYEN